MADLPLSFFHPSEVSGSNWSVPASLPGLEGGGTEEVHQDLLAYIESFPADPPTTLTDYQVANWVYAENGAAEMFSFMAPVPPILQTLPPLIPGVSLQPMALHTAPPPAFAPPFHFTLAMVCVPCPLIHLRSLTFFSFKKLEDKEILCLLGLEYSADTWKLVPLWVSFS